MVLARRMVRALSAMRGLMVVDVDVPVLVMLLLVSLLVASGLRNLYGSILLEAWMAFNCLSLWWCSWGVYMTPSVRGDHPAAAEVGARLRLMVLVVCMRDDDVWVGVAAVGGASRRWLVTAGWAF